MTTTHAGFPNVRAAVQAAFVRLLLIVLGLGVPTAVFAAFGYTDNGTAYVVDTGAGLVFQVRKTDGTVTSIVFNGTEYNGPSGKGSHIASGLGTPTTVTPETDGSTYVKIALQTGPANGVVSSLTHYLIVRPGENTIYMATYTTAEPAVGELRWITRLNAALIPNGPGPSDNTGTTGAIESSDVFGKADGTTSSKYYGDGITHGKDRAMDLTYCGATGPGIGCWMVFGNRESSSGGPFFRDIQNQNGGDQEIYNYMNSGHNQTEAYRVDNVLHGPYALVFTAGAPPALPVDFSWLGSLGLTGWVPASGRGTVSGTAAGIPVGFQGVVGFANSSAQYWATVSGGSYTCPGMKPGTYGATLYKGELGVATGTVTVTAGAITPLNLAATEPAPSVIFRIGEWDGTPSGFLNAQNIVRMHPSDVRNAGWGPVTYTVGTDGAGSFPAVQFRGANSPSTIRFNLAPNQVTDLVVRIGITSAYINARPVIGVNGAFTSAVPAQSTQPNSRSVTIGTYRGNNALFTYTIPAGALVAGLNTMTISPATGSSDAGTWLSANFAYDAIELDGPVAAPVISYVGAGPLVISGTAEPSRNIALLLDGAVPAGSTVASAGGVWSIVCAVPVPAGSHSFTAVASDDAGHSSPASAPFPFDTGVVMPAVTAAIGDTGTYANGATTTDRAFVFAGTAAAGDTVTLTRIGTGVIATVVADGAGGWTFDYTTTSLPDGVNGFYATASHGGGNSASSPVFTLNLLGQPRVAIARFNPATATIPTGLPAVVYRVTFNHAVSGVTPGAFALTATGTATGTIAGVSAAGGTTFDVTVAGLAGTGTLRLDLLPNVGVVDGGGNPEAGYTAGESYALVVATTGSGTWIRPATGGLWSDPANWQNAVIADGAGNSASFSTLDITANNTVHLDSARTAGTLSFSDSVTASPASWIVDNNGSGANTLTLAGGTPTIAVTTLGTGATATISANLAGGSGLTKTGAGVLVLASPNSLTGNATVSAGTLRIAPGGSLAAGNVSIAVGGAQVNVAGGTFAASGTLTVNAGSGSALVVDAGTATFNALATSNTAGGILRINGGSVTAASVNVPRSSDASPSFAAGLIVAGGSTTITGPVGLGTSNSWGSMSVEGGALAVNGPVTLGNQASGGRGGQMRVINNAIFTSTDTALGVLMCRNNGVNANNVATAAFSGGTSFVEKFTLGFDASVTAGSATITVNGGTLYLGGGGIVKNGAATMATTVSLASGTLGAKASWSTAVPVTLATGGNITVNTADAGDNPFNIAFNGAVGGAGSLTKTGDGTLVLDGAVTHTYTGTTTVNAGALRVTGTLGAAANAVVVNGGGLLTGNGQINRPVTLNAGGTIAPDGPAASAALGGTSVTWNGDALFACDLGAAGSSDQLVLTGALTKGTAGSYTVACTPGAGFAAGNTYTLATFGSTNFTAADFTATGLPAGTGARFIVTGTSLQLQVQGVPAITSALTAAGVFGAPFSYPITSTEPPVTFGATGLPPGLAVDPLTGIISGIPAAAGGYTVALTATNAAGTGGATLALAIAKASASVTLGNLSATYDGAPHPASVSVTPPGLVVGVTYDGSAAAPVNAGSYSVVAAVHDANYAGGATATLVIAPAAQTITFPNPGAKTYGDAPFALTATASSNLAVSYSVVSGPAAVSGGMVTITGAGAVTLRAVQAGNDNYLAAPAVDVTFTVAPAAVTITLGGLHQAYDGTPKPVTAITTPAGVAVDITYDGSTTPPTLPGTYDVVATIGDPNYTGTAAEGTLEITVTALVRHGPTLNGDIDGSLQLLSAEGFAVNGNNYVAGDLLVPGTPAIRLNGHPQLVGTQDAAGAATPSDYTVTLNGNSVVRYIVRRVDPIPLPAVAAPQAPAGTRDVNVNNAGQNVGDFATIRNLTLNGNAGVLAVPPGAYGNLTANGSGGFILGVAGATEPAVYHLQRLTLNGNATLQIVGPVVLRLGNGLTLNGTMGSSSNPEWLELGIFSGGLTLNGNATLHGLVAAPNGTVIINGGSTLHGRVSADRLTINGNAVLQEPAH